MLRSLVAVGCTALLGRMTVSGTGAVVPGKGRRVVDRKCELLHNSPSCCRARRVIFNKLVDQVMWALVAGILAGYVKISASALNAQRRFEIG